MNSHLISALSRRYFLTATVLFLFFSVFSPEIMASDDFHGPKPKAKRFRSAEELIQELKHEPRLQPEQTGFGILYITLGKYQRAIRVYYGQKNLMIEVLLVDRQSKKLSKDSIFMTVPGLEEPNDLPLRWSVPEEKRLALARILKDKNLQFSSTPGGLASGEKLEGYSLRMMIHFGKDRESLLAIIAHLCATTFAGAQSPYILEI